MKRCRPSPWLVACALLVLLPPVARATTVIAPSFDRMVETSDYIVRVTVRSINSAWRTSTGQRYIGSQVELDVHEVIKGSPPSPLVLDLVGGRVGDQELTIQGAPRFVVGQEHILFVKGNGRRIIPLVGMMHGKYDIRRDQRTGREEILRFNGQPLYAGQEVSAPESAAGATPAEAGKATPLTPAEFISRIRQSAKTTGREKLN
jgi:hypothetical protein